MTISLGGVTLSDHLVLQGIESAPGVAWSSRRTLGGRAVVQIGPTLPGGRELSLQSENHLTHAQVVAIKNLDNLGQAVALVHPRLSASVLITGVEVEPDQQLVDPAATGATVWYSGVIKLLEV